MTDAASYAPSASALAPLMATFWEPSGWRRPRARPAREVMLDAIDAGVMFGEPRVEDHDGWVAAARAAAGLLFPAEVGAAFLASLSSGRLDLRSALGSFAVARYLPGHRFAGPGWCQVCHIYVERDRTVDAHDLNVLRFERFKWGGVRHDSIEYLAFDLEQFARAPKRTPAAADIRLARQVIDYLRQLPPETTAAQAVPGLKMIPGNKHHRAKLLDILGLSGILHIPQYPAYTGGFVPYTERHMPSQRYIFGSYPTCWWRAGGGISPTALQEYLPQLT